MWKLTITDKIVSDYITKMLPGLVKRVKEWGHKDNQGNFTLYPFTEIRDRLLPDYKSDDPQDTATLEHLLTDKPQESYDLNNDLMSEFVKDANGKPCYNEKDLPNYKTLTAYKCLNTIETVFDYRGQLSHSKNQSYWLSNLVGRNTCTYCNRQYTFTVERNDGKEHLTRPNFDHWFPKSLFPLLSLNLYNLIPCCTICNSGAKGDSVFHLQDYIHPYTQQDDDPNFKFFPAISDVPNDGWHVVLDRDVSDVKIDNTIKAFNLDDIYDMHGALEVKEIMDFAQAYNGTYLHILYNTLQTDFGCIGYTQEEVYRMLFGTESIPSKYLDRPLSKLKRDILSYLHIIQ